jgi:predicted enzyme related to lactoylglutathione lyase
MPRSIISGVGTLMFFQDTEGNVFGAMQYDANAE